MRASERGFSLLEVLVGCALTAAVVLGATGAVAHALHGAALANEKMALSDDALSALGDVRTLVAYDTINGPNPTKLQRLVGRSATMTLARSPVSLEHITLTVSVPVGNTPPIAVATVSADGIEVTEQQALSVEAPAPGSSVQQR